MVRHRPGPTAANRRSQAVHGRPTITLYHPLSFTVYGARPKRSIASVRTRSTTSGWLWPIEVVRIPLKKSRYLIPLPSITSVPCHYTSANGSP